MVAYTFYESDNRVRRYAEALVARGDTVDAVALRRDGQPEFEVIRGVNVYRIQSRTIDETGPLSYLRKLLAFFFRSAWWLTTRHARAPYQLLHVHSVPDFQVFAALIPRLSGARIILDIHDIVPEFYASKFAVTEASLLFRLLVLVERISAAFSHHVIISNHLWHHKLTARSVTPAKCTPLINYPDRRTFHPRPRTRPAGSEFVLCYPGTLMWHQGVDLAVRAMERLRDAAPDLRFLIVGDGADRERIKRMIAESGLEDRIRLVGLLPIEQVAETLANVDAGIVPKRAEGFGDEAFSTKIPEFMAMGIPVIASRTRIDQHYFNDSMIQFFEPGNVDDLAAKILTLMHRPDKRAVLIEGAREFVRANNWDVKKHAYLDLVDSLVHGTPRKPVTAEPESRTYSKIAT